MKMNKIKLEIYLSEKEYDLLKSCAAHYGQSDDVNIVDRGPENIAAIYIRERLQEVSKTIDRIKHASHRCHQ